MVCNCQTIARFQPPLSWSILKWVTLYTTKTSCLTWGNIEQLVNKITLHNSMRILSQSRTHILISINRIYESISLKKHKVQHIYTTLVLEFWNGNKHQSEWRTWSKTQHTFISTVKKVWLHWLRPQSNLILCLNVHPVPSQRNKICQNCCWLHCGHADDGWWLIHTEVIVGWGAVGDVVACYLGIIFFWVIPGQLHWCQGDKYPNNCGVVHFPRTIWNGGWTRTYNSKKKVLVFQLCKLLAWWLQWRGMSGKYYYLKRIKKKH